MGYSSHSLHNIYDWKGILLLHRDHSKHEVSSDFHSFGRKILNDPFPLVLCHFCQTNNTEVFFLLLIQSPVPIMFQLEKRNHSKCFKQMQFHTKHLLLEGQ